MRSLLAAAGSRADELPEQTIRVVVPLTAGSSLDARARVIVDALGQRLKRRVIVENRPGAGGTIGTSLVARAKPDGSTLLFTNNSIVISAHIYPKPGYDPRKDFAPVSPAYLSGMVLVVHPKRGAGIGRRAGGVGALTARAVELCLQRHGRAPAPGDGAVRAGRRH